MKNLCILSEIVYQYCPVKRFDVNNVKKKKNNTKAQPSTFVVLQLRNKSITIVHHFQIASIELIKS